LINKREGLQKKKKGKKKKQSINLFAQSPSTYPSLPFHFLSVSLTAGDKCLTKPFRKCSVCERETCGPDTHTHTNTDKLMDHAYCSNSPPSHWYH